MLVDIAKLIQLPKQMILSRARSYVRLKSLDLSCNFIGKPRESLAEVSAILTSRDGFVDRKADYANIVSQWAAPFAMPIDRDQNADNKGILREASR